MELPIAYYGEPVLRKKGLPVEEINDEIRKLVADMIETMHARHGIGLAAPQVFKSLALFVTHVPIRQEDDSWIDGPLRVFINPKVISVSEELSIDSEGCLSIPKIHLPVARPLRATLRAMDLEGNIFEETFEGLAARCVLHENDHTNGTLFIDRVRGKARKEIEPKLRKIQQEHKAS
jgi:peptide deformylase